MATFQFGFGNPSNYSDWATYAGLDRKTGQFVQKPAKAGVPPPESFTDFIGQAVAPAKQAFANFGNAASQLTQGNIGQAYNTMTSAGIMMPAPSIPSIYDFESQIGQ